MRRRDKIIILIMIIATLLLGIGYASIQNITLNVIGTVSAEAPASVLSNMKIGDYVDLGNDIVDFTGTGVTTDDWRILNINEDGTIELILADFLPNSTGYASSAGLQTSGTYNVYSNTNRDTLLNALTDTSNWSALTNNIPGATAVGAPTNQLFIDSFNTKNGTSLSYETYYYPLSGYSKEDCDLYVVPHTSSYSERGGYWLASPRTGFAGLVWGVGNDVVCTGGYNYARYCVRPVVSLPSGISFTNNNGVWKVNNSSYSNAPNDNSINFPKPETSNAVENSINSANTVSDNNTANTNNMTNTIDSNNTTNTTNTTNSASSGNATLDITTKQDANQNVLSQNETATEPENTIKNEDYESSNNISNTDKEELDTLENINGTSQNDANENNM